MRKVLIVENNATITKLLSHFFHKFDCETTIVEDGLAAMIVLENNLPDIIVTDIIMPKIGGDQLCQIIRNNSTLKDIFLVIHSSVTVEDTARILSLDADVYIAKGNSGHYKNHIQHIINQYDNGVRRDKRIIGGENFHKHEVTQELLLAKHHQQTIFNNIADAVIELDINAKIIQVNKAATLLFDQTIGKLLSKNLFDYLSGPDLADLKLWFDNSHQPPQQTYESSFNSPLIINNHQVLLKIVSLSNCNDTFYIVIIQDISPQKAVEAKLEATLLDLDAVLESIDYGVCFVDKTLQIRLVNQAFRDMWGITTEQAESALTCTDLLYLNRYNNIYNIADEEFDEYVHHRIEQIRKGAVEQTDMVLKNGSVYRYQCTELPDNGRMLTYYDITSLRQTQDELAGMLTKVSDLANHDPLTKLANLRLAREKINMSLAVATRQNKQVALMFIDLDGFKEVNDSLGHEAGDQVLKMVAHRLGKVASRATDTIARIGGDEFIIVQTEVKNLNCVKEIAEQVLSTLNQPFEVAENKIAQIGASIGIAMYPNDGKTESDLLKCADNAMYKIKKDGKNGYIFASDC